jgi:hypothetical protein
VLNRIDPMRAQDPLGRTRGAPWPEVRALVVGRPPDPLAIAAGAVAAGLWRALADDGR